MVFALDSSGSMAWNDPNGSRKTAAKDFVGKMNSTKDQAGVVSWDDGIDFTQALSSNFSLVNATIDAVDSSGGTNLNVGLNGAIGVLDANTRTENSSEVMIFLSNGAGTYTYAANGGPASTAASKGYVIYSIGLGPNPATAALTDMATATGGKYYPSPTASNLDAIFNGIYREIINNTIPHYVDVVEVTQSYIIGEGSFNPTPDSVTTDPVTGITTITWNDIGTGDGDPDLSDDETVTLSFTAKSNQCGANLDVDVFGTAKVNYDDKDGNYAGSVDIPQAKINVNCPPVADAGPDQTVEQSYYQGASVKLDGLGSSDPDGDSLTYSWTWVGGTATGTNPIISLPLGTTTITLTVSDGALTDTDTVVVTVVDTTPPVIICPADVTVEQETAAGTVVSLTAATATDICDADVEITDDAPEIFPLGTTTVTFTATDDSGNSATCTTTVTVIDTTPPEMTLSDEQIVLWPPNHKYHTIEIAECCVISVTDICDADVDIDDVVITSVSSDEPENVQGEGDGNTVDDIVIVDSQTVELRAERQGDGNGRVYTINFEVTDDSGNMKTGSCTVWVVHDQGSGDTAVDDGASAGYTVYP
jgi:Ca-activated chloride channel family protein